MRCADVQEMNCTFRPHINRKSRDIDQQANQDVLAPGQSRIDLMFQRAEEYEFRRARSFHPAPKLARLSSCMYVCARVILYVHGIGCKKPI